MLETVFIHFILWVLVGYFILNGIYDIHYVLIFFKFCSPAISLVIIIIFALFIYYFAFFYFIYVHQGLKTA